MNSLELFHELLTLCDDIIDFTEKSKTFPGQFEFNKLNEKCYSKIYKGMKEVIPRKDLFTSIEDLDKQCSACWKFYLAPRNKSVKIFDLHLGKKFEKKILEFLKSKGVDCRTGDKENKMFPDNVVYQGDEKKAYLEIKYQSAPWIFAFREKDTNRECYEGSTALDIKKLKQQQELVDEGKITVPVYYVYWLDFPCVKGIFFISLEDMHNFYKNEAKIFDRKEREGDFKVVNGQKKKISATAKIHPSLFNMKSFEELLEVLK